jgi:aconitate hydratase
VSGKDLILTLLRDHSCKAGIGKIMEFFGPGVANLDMSARATIANMAVDMGFTAGIFPSDEITRQWLAQNGREHAWRELKAGPKPQWDELTEIRLDAIEPMVACPSNPDNVKKAAELSEVEVQQVIIGSSCNGSYRDFMIAAKIVEGKTRHKNVNFEINTGSRQTFDNVLAAGGIAALLEAGARIHESGCLGCIGMGQAPGTGTNSLRTFPRNFKGRSGTKDDHVYLCSPETAAASALTATSPTPVPWGRPPPSPIPNGTGSGRTGSSIRPGTARPSRFCAARTSSPCRISSRWRTPWKARS